MTEEDQSDETMRRKDEKKGREGCPKDREDEKSQRKGLKRRVKREEQESLMTTKRKGPNRRVQRGGKQWTRRQEGGPNESGRTRERKEKAMKQGRLSGRPKRQTGSGGQ